MKFAGINSSPPRGMRDLLPDEVELRDFVMSAILSTYRKYGFSRIETPALENIDLLCSGEGGENEKLIFKILKRGEKLNLRDQPIQESNLADLGLRFDLTVPLARYYADNFSKLPLPFKAIQIGSVWRAERPQKGRYRQFTQCDIDIIGLESEIAEAELVVATSDALLAMGFSDFTVRINDRRILLALAEYCGFDADSFNSVFISLDKLDKVGIEGVHAELIDRGHSAKSVNTLIDFLKDISSSQCEVRDIQKVFSTFSDKTLFDALDQVMKAIDVNSQNRYSVKFDPTLVRGMSYYTGQIFEISYKNYPFSIAGGGRYDKMIGKMLSRDVPACGFSIGFERIIYILQEESYKFQQESNRIALLFDETSSLTDILTAAQALRDKGNMVSIQPRQKKQRKQLDELADRGFKEFCVVNAEDQSLKTRPLSKEVT